MKSESKGFPARPVLPAKPNNKYENVSVFEAFCLVLEPLIYWRRFTSRAIDDIMSFMIEKNTEIVPDMVVRHVEGLIYKVEDVRTSTAGYEKTHELGATVVNYVQLEQGDFPPGHPWSKPEDEFREYFSVISLPEISNSV